MNTTSCHSKTFSRTVVRKNILNPQHPLRSFAEGLGIKPGGKMCGSKLIECRPIGRVDSREIRVTGKCCDSLITGRFLGSMIKVLCNQPQELECGSV